MINAGVLTGGNPVKADRVAKTIVEILNTGVGGATVDVTGKPVTRNYGYVVVWT